MKVRIPIDLSILNAPSKEGIFPVISTPLNRNYIQIDLINNELFRYTLTSCTEWIDYDVLVKKIADKFKLTTHECDELLVELLHTKLIVSDESSDYKKIYKTEEKWVNNGWGKSLGYHIITNNLKKTDYWDDPEGKEDQQRMIKKVNEDKIPSHFKEYETSSVIPLTKDKLDSPLDLVFRDYVGRDKGKKTMSKNELGTLLYYSFGQTHEKIFPVTGRHIGKTSPSGGSRHPTEAYIIIHNVEDIPSGLYHYSVKNHTLELLREEELSDFVQEHVICKKHYPTFNKKITIIHTTLFERSMHRYREPRSYRAINHDIGHLMQTTALVASALGLNSYRGYSMHDSIVDRLIGVDGIYESSMTYTVVG